MCIRDRPASGHLSHDFPCSPAHAEGTRHDHPPDPESGSAMRRDPQAFSLRKTAVPHQVARANRATAHVVPQSLWLLERSPTKVSPTSSTIQRNGMKSLTHGSQSGPIVMGSRIPESSSTGIILSLIHI